MQLKSKLGLYWQTRVLALKMPAGHALGSLLCGSFPLELSFDSELYLWAWLVVVIKCRTLGSTAHRLEEWEVATKRVNREPMGVAEVQNCPGQMGFDKRSADM